MDFSNRACHFNDCVCRLYHLDDTRITLTLSATENTKIMADQSVINELLREWMFSLPILVVWIAGFVIAIGRWREHPKVATLVMISCGMSVLTTLLMPVILRVVPRLMPFVVLPVLISVSWTCLAAVPAGLLIYAVFVGRGEKIIK